LSEEEEIKTLMAKEIVEDVCEAVGEANRAKCRAVLHKILVEGRGFEVLTELPEDCRKTVKEKLKELGVE
jgi:hypothetical protein